MYGSQSSSRCKNYRMLMAKWAGDYSKLDPHFGDIRPGRILHYLQHSLEVDDTVRTHILASVGMVYGKSDFGYCHPVTVWKNKFQNDGQATYIPVQRIMGKCAWTKKKHGHQSYIVVCPLPRRVFS